MNMKNNYLIYLGIILMSVESFAGTNANYMDLPANTKNYEFNSQLPDYNKIPFKKIIYLKGLNTFLKVEAGERLEREKKGLFSTSISKGTPPIKSPMKKFRESSFLYVFMPIYQSNGTFGMEAGRLKLEGIGWFASFKANLGAADAASPDNELDRKIINKDNYDLGAASLSLGITKSIVYPLHVYVGGGVAYHKYYTGDDIDITAVNLGTESGYYPFPEAALGVQIGNMAFKGGAAYIADETYFHIGIGFGG